MTPEYIDARHKLLWAILWYAIVALGPLVVGLIICGTVFGWTTRLSDYQKLLLAPVFLWGLFWVNMMLSYVRSHPLPK